MDEVITTKNITSDKEFVIAWQTGTSAQQVADDLGLKRASATCCALVPFCHAITKSVSEVIVTVLVVDSSILFILLFLLLQPPSKIGGACLKSP